MLRCKLWSVAYVMAAVAVGCLGEAASASPLPSLTVTTSPISVSFTNPAKVSPGAPLSASFIGLPGATSFIIAWGDGVFDQGPIGALPITTDHFYIGAPGTEFTGTVDLLDANAADLAAGDFFVEIETAISEPSMLAASGLALTALAAVRRRRRA